MPDSVILFGTYDELHAVSPNETQTIKPPIELPANHGYFVRPSLSPNAELIAWGFVTRIDDGKAHFSLGVYTLKDRTWKTYGDFRHIGQAWFSTDSRRVMFLASESEKTNLINLDVAAGSLTIVAPSPGWTTITASSLSPDGRRVAVVIQRNASRAVALVNVSGGQMVEIGEGDYPTWSPDGNWIAFFDEKGSKCILTRADGAHRRVLKALKQAFFSYKRFGWGVPVWSPDGRYLLLTIMKGDGDYMDVVVIRVDDGHEIRTAHNHSPAFGWAIASVSNNR